MVFNLFNRQERMILASLCAVLFAGSVLRYLVVRYPRIGDIVNSVEDGRFVSRVSVNTAGYDELVAIPYIGDFTARQLIAHRPFRSLEEVRAVPGVRENNFERFKNHLVVK
jgi:radical SAM superfamily enzyme with C-terminal helix-hairpin-helix motif